LPTWIAELSRRRDSLSPQLVEPFKEAGCDGTVYGDRVAIV
jgi:hypothetical protein